MVGKIHNTGQGVDVQFGSIASFWSSTDYFRSSPGNGHCQNRSPCLKSAKSRLHRLSPADLRQHRPVRPN